MIWGRCRNSRARREKTKSRDERNVDGGQKGRFMSTDG